MEENYKWREPDIYTFDNSYDYGDDMRILFFGKELL